LWSCVAELLSRLSRRSFPGVAGVAESVGAVAGSGPAHVSVEWYTGIPVS
jgi:hypothetical protein